MDEVPLGSRFGLDFQLREVLLLRPSDTLRQQKKRGYSRRNHGFHLRIPP